MAERVVLHIGAMKSGTSFVQNVLGANPERLREAGVLFPGNQWQDQVRAVREFNARGRNDTSPMDPDGPWMQLAREINDWSGTAVVSMEFLGPRSTAQIGLILDSLSAGRVEAVLSVRDLTRSIPAMWLESVQNGSSVTWPDFLDGVRKRSKSARSFWRHQDAADIAKRWMGAVGADRFTLVTVPPPGAPGSLLWERFAGILDIDPGAYETDVRANPAIGLATALVLRRLNEEIYPDRVPWSDYNRYVKQRLAKRGLVTRQGDEPRLGFDTAWGAGLADEQVAALRALGCRVVGDLEELRPRAVPGIHTDDVSLEQQLDAATAGLAYLVDAWARSEEGAGRRKGRRDGQIDDGGST